MRDPLVVEMPSIPPPELRGNSRAHWAKKRRAARVMGDEATALLSGATWRPERIKITFEFHHWRLVDLDNLCIGLKSWVDAAVVMLGMVDKKGDPLDDPEHVVYGQHSFVRCGRGESKTTITIEETP